MKTNHKFSFLALAILLVMACLPAVTSCGDDEPAGKLTDNLLVGTWTAHRDGITMTLEFAPNHQGGNYGYGSRSWSDPLPWRIVSKNEIQLYDDEIAIWVSDGTPYGHILYDGETYTKTSTSYRIYN